MTRRTSLAFTVAVLASCGSSPPPLPDAGATDSGRPDAGTDAGPPPCPIDEWPVAAATREAGVLEELNARRAAGGSCGAVAVPPSAPLRSDPALTRAARCQAWDIMIRGMPSGTGLDGSTYAERAAREGYPGHAAVESYGILGDTQSAVQIVDLVLDDRSACEVLLGDGTIDLGVGFVRDPDATGTLTTYFDVVAGD